MAARGVRYTTVWKRCKSQGHGQRSNQKGRKRGETFVAVGRDWVDMFRAVRNVQDDEQYTLLLESTEYRSAKLYCHPGTDQGGNTKWPDDRRI